MIVLDFFVGQQSDQTVLKGAEAAFDLAFCLGIGGNAMSHTHGGKSALELGMGIQAVSGGSVAKKAQSIGVKTGGQARFFDDGSEVGEVCPGRVGRCEKATEDFARVIVQRQDQARILFCWPPGMGRTVMLPEFADGSNLPAGSSFGAALGGRHQMREMLTDVSGDRCARAVEIKFAGQFVGDQREVKGFAMREKLDQKIAGVLWPDGFVITAGGYGSEVRFVTQPLVTQAIELSLADMQTLGGAERIELARIKGGENFLNVERWDTMDELFFS